MAEKKQLLVFDRLWAEASARQWDFHPAELVLRAGESLSLDLMSQLIQQFDHARNARVPISVHTKTACSACWKHTGTSKAMSMCACCKAWALCATCHAELEGNCFQCLFTDQRDKAEAIKASRRRAAAGGGAGGGAASGAPEKPSEGACLFSLNFQISPTTTFTPRVVANPLVNPALSLAASPAGNHMETDNLV